MKKLQPEIKRFENYEFFRSVTDAIKIVRKGFIATAAGSEGAINFYRDYIGLYKCEYMQQRVTLDEKTFKKQKDAVTWLKKTIPKIKIEK